MFDRGNAGTGRTIALAAVAILLTVGVTAAAESRIDFSNIPPGTIVDEIYAGYGVTGSLKGIIKVNGYNPALWGQAVCAAKPPCNAAVVFDSANPTGGDDDLGTPNECVGGPGIDSDLGDGAGGECGSPFENLDFLGHLLVVNQYDRFVDRDASQTIDANDSPVTVADDDDIMGQYLEFDFSGVKGGGVVTVNSLTYLDNDEGEFGAQVEFSGPDFDTKVVGLPALGDNGVLTLNFGVEGVRHMKVLLNGSGAITEAVIQQNITERACWVTTGGFDKGTIVGTSGKKTCTFGGNVGPPPSGALEVNWHDGPLTGSQFHTNEIVAIRCEDSGSTGPQQPGGKKGLEVDTLFFDCTGSFNHVDGYTCDGYLKDGGEPAGKNGNDRDAISVTVRDGDGAVVAECIGELDGGNVQIHPPVGGGN